MWTSTREGVWLIWTHVDRGGGQKSDFFVDVIRGWPLKTIDDSAHNDYDDVKAHNDDNDDNAQKDNDDDNAHNDNDDDNAQNDNDDDNAHYDDDDDNARNDAAGDDVDYHHFVPSS